MRKKSILMVCISALIALAVFVGCDNAPVYPAWPTGGYVSQVGDILNGQAFDASKFQVVATYLDNSKKVIDASVVFEDVDKSGNVTAGDTVSSTAGTDYYGNLVPANGTVSVYNIDSIDFTVAEGADYTSLEAGDLTVTANYYNGKGELTVMPLSSTEYTVSVSSEAGEDDTTVYTITVTTSVGGNVKSSEKISVADEPEVLGTIVDITTITPNKYSVPGFLYDELPAIDASKFRIGVLLEDGDSDTGIVDGDTIEGLELAFVNQRTGAVLDKALDEYDFRNATDIGVRATFEGKSIYTESAITVDAATLTVEYKGAGIAENATLPEIIPADYRVLLTVVGNKAVDITEEANLYYAEEDWTATTDKTMTADGITVVASYMGILNSTKIEPGEAAPVTVESVEFTMAKDWTAPAKQYYETLPTIAVSDVAKVVVTKSDGTVNEYSSIVGNDSFGIAFYTAEGVELTGKSGDNGFDTLVNADSILVGLQLGDEVFYLEYDLTTAVAERVELYADYGDVAYYGAPVDWTIKLVNDEGVVDPDYQGAYTAYVVANSKATKTDLPATLSTEASYKVAVVLDDVPVESVAVDLVAGDEWYELDSDFAVTYTGDKIYIDDDLDIAKTSFDVTGYTYHGTKTEEAAKLSADSVAFVTDETVSATNTVYVTVTYTGKDLETHSEVVAVSVNGTSWGEAPTATLVWAETESNVTSIPAGTYNVSDFIVKGYVEHGDSPVTLIVKPQNGSEVTAGTFTVNQYETVTFSYSYVGKSGEVGPVTLETFTAAAPAAAN